MGGFFLFISRDVGGPCCKNLLQHCACLERQGFIKDGWAPQVCKLWNPFGSTTISIICIQSISFKLIEHVLYMRSNKCPRPQPGHKDFKFDINKLSSIVLCCLFLLASFFTFFFNATVYENLLHIICACISK